MPPKPKATGSFVYVVLDGSEIDSVHATSTAASQRAVELDSEETEVVKKELQGGSVQADKKVAAEPKSAKAKTAKRKRSEDPEPAPKPKKKAAPKKAAKIEEEEEDADDEPKPKISKAKTKTPAEQRAANAKKPVKPEDSDLPDNVKALLASSGNSLQGKTIVVTGVPPTLGRKNAETLVEKYGGRLTKSLSKKTSLVVVGNDAGPTKLEKIADLGVETMNEDEFVALLEG
ncbi:Replication factor C subunit 1 protein [Venturia nashicola]|uniref:Replication factor C subunit 1 protein n=1 Tax=Venturia nashicola TaxID=86259 RepID=A0A4Z1NV78_9PEZI|nr:Replication factor C subunit 1 protein [Venturia nashicola]